ncbi:MAG: hypothetical protein GTN76_00205 [Candidatus Aenigmarchaeota archaeon]|nr:hypothetical protein [Candidatus Aenigmarchaeota archaeon]
MKLRKLQYFAEYMFNIQQKFSGNRNDVYDVQDCSHRFLGRNIVYYKDYE